MWIGWQKRLAPATTTRRAAARRLDTVAVLATATPDHSLSRAAVALRKLSRARHPHVAVVRRRGDRRLLAVIDAADQRVHTLRSVEQLVDDLATGAGELGVLDDTSRPPAPGAAGQFSDESFVGLCWQVGARLGRDVGLAPWLNATTSHRLLRRPDAADLGNDADAARLVDLMAKRELGVAAMVDIAQLPHRTVVQLVNSMSLCGLLDSASAMQRRSARAPRASRQPPPQSGHKLGWLKSLWRRMVGRASGR